MFILMKEWTQFVQVGVLFCLWQENGEIVLPQDMQKCQVYAGRKISFEPEEVTQMKKFDSSGLEFHAVISYQSHFCWHCLIAIFLAISSCAFVFWCQHATMSVYVFSYV